ncbi:hypothetical protein WS99_21535 [Burkholderia territorii]|nr:hypothetical protein WS99_21535 [Burkholderia territorii]KVQ66887.1 hypothetical protein WT23_02015 [Burkholderia territorii]
MSACIRAGTLVLHRRSRAAFSYAEEDHLMKLHQTPDPTRPEPAPDNPPEPSPGTDPPVPLPPDVPRPDMPPREPGYDTPIAR